MTRFKPTPALFYVLGSFLACVFLFFSASLTVLATANKVDPDAFGGTNRLEFYQTKGSLSSVDLSGISGGSQYNVNKEEGRYVKDIIWDAPNKVTKNSKITAHFKNVASYDGKDLNCDVVLSNFNNMHRSLNSATSVLTHNKKNYREFVRFCNNLYNGIDIQGFGAMNMQLNFTYSSNGKALNLDAPSGTGRDSKGAYLTLACLDGHYHQRLDSFEDGKGIVQHVADHKEFVGYQNMNKYPYYVTSNTVLGEYAAPMKSANNLCPNVTGGRAESGYSTDDHFDGMFGSPTYNLSGGTYTLQGTNPQFMVGTNIYSMYFSFTTASIWSKFPPAPSKESYNKAQTDAAANNINKKYIPKGSDVYYHIKQTFGQLGIDQMTQYKAFSIKDQFDSSKLDYNSKDLSNARLLYKNGNSWQEVDKGASYKLSDNTITYTASNGLLSNASNYGKTFVLELHFKTKTDTSGILKNTAQTTFNNNYTQNTNTVESFFLNPPTKTVTQNGKDVNGHNTGQKGTPTGPLNLGSIVSYTINQKWHQKGIDMDNDHYSQFSIEDTVDKNLVLQTDSVKVIDQSTGTDVTAQGTLSYDKSSSTISWNSSSAFLKNQTLNGRTLSLTFDTKTPLKQTRDIYNTGEVKVENVATKTNQTAIGVDNDFPVLVFPRTGNKHLLFCYLATVTLLILASIYLLKKTKGLRFSKKRGCDISL
ncbi:isopeptide-forming domain-containing fimbrial protein [Enterococcus gilvus]|uniref:isopeptide-forming domain-containing fimbrial protein n=1 Tax=Enterococcus gilvus TaxID=160453 RepID=UPI003EDAC6A6